VSEFTMRLRLEHGKAVEFHGPADITQETTEAIVNAANSSLLGGGGVDGAIHRAGGSSILTQCQDIVSKNGRLAPGHAVLTTGGRLAAKWVIHTVGPVYGSEDQDEPEILANCYRACIRLADEKGIQSISFPSISTGAYGYPVSEAAEIAVATAVRAVESAQQVSQVRFVLFDVSTMKAYTRAAERLSKTSPQYRMEKSSS